MALCKRFFYPLADPKSIFRKDELRIEQVVAMNRWLRHKQANIRIGYVSVQLSDGRVEIAL